MTFLLVLVSIALFFLSGWMFLRVVFGSHAPLSVIETVIYSFSLGVAILDFSLILLGTSGTKFSPAAVFSAFLMVPTILFLLRLSWERFSGRLKRPAIVVDSPFIPSKRESLAFVLIVALTILLKTIFLSDAALPTATDLGHHMYWAKAITETGMLPDYSKREITEADGVFFLSDPEPIADFIIGEHLPFAAIAILSGASFFSAFPVNFLLLANLLALFALFAFSVRIASELFAGKNVSPFSAGLVVLLVAGPLFALSSPQAKFVSGGVVGNAFGNLFIPLILLSLFRALREKDSRFLALGIFLSFGLAYTHHLSSLMLLFVFAGIALSLVALFPRVLPALARTILSLFRSPYPVAAILFAGLFFSAVAMPTYIETHAVGTAIGTPSKTTRTGLSFLQASDSVGASRMALGLAGLLIALSFRSLRHTAALAFTLGWSGALLIMTLHPDWVFLDIPSNRIGAYLSFPIAVIAGLFVASLPRTLSFIPGRLFLLGTLVLFGFAAWNGSADNQSALPDTQKKQETAEVFHASAYLAARTDKGDFFLKDHNYLTADAWMKLFFMRGYDYPLSRGYFKRYEDETNPREQCTLLMISTPNLPAGKKCYDELGVNFVAINPAYDTAQFEKSSAFSRVYAADYIHLYERH